MSFLIAIVDAAIVLAGALILAVVGIGHDVRIAGHLVRIHRIDGALAVLYVVAFARYLLPSVPFFGIAAWSTDRLRAWTLSTVRHLHSSLTRLDVKKARRWVLACGAICLLLKLLNAYFYYGFFAGDDIEIHEMTFNRLFNLHSPILPVRSAFYPMVFIYPIQKLLATLGVTSAHTLVFAGRAVVALLSTVSVLLIFDVGRRLYGTPVGVIAATFLATNALGIQLGSSELPRPVATLFVLLSFRLLLTPRLWNVVFAGALIGIAGAMRFSEIMFLAPALLWLTLERRWRDAVLVAGSTVMVAAAIQILSDLWLWGTPFSSFVSIFNFTLVERASSRGYEPFWFYARFVGTWADVVVVGFALWATRRHWRLAIWAWLPLLVLSLLPHKEARYLLPAVPFVLLLAAAGVWHLLERVSSGASDASLIRKQQLSLAFAALAVASLVFQASGYHFHRSERAIDLAMSLDRRPQIHALVIDQGWRMGGRLYLRKTPELIDLDLSAASAIAARHDVDTIAIIRTNCARISCGEEFGRLGYSEEVFPEQLQSGYQVFQRRRKP